MKQKQVKLFLSEVTKSLPAAWIFLGLQNGAVWWADLSPAEIALHFVGALLLAWISILIGSRIAFDLSGKENAGLPDTVGSCLIRLIGTFAFLLIVSVVISQ